ncbi:hypothetical protein WA158_007154 [Blastocystis sp. Blastoise]
MFLGIKEIDINLLKSLTTYKGVYTVTEPSHSSIPIFDIQNSFKLTIIPFSYVNCNYDDFCLLFKYVLSHYQYPNIHQKKYSHFKLTLTIYYAPIIGVDILIHDVNE